MTTEMKTPVLFPVALALGSAAMLLSISNPVGALEYEKDIMPIFEKKCSDCHSKTSKKIKGGLRLDDPEHFQKRFSKNDVVVPGDWDASYLFITLYRPADDEDAMPPKGKGERLTKEEVKLVQQWITEGAPINGQRGKRGKMPEDEEKASPGLPDNATLPVEQSWTNREGKTIRATALRVEGDVVLLRMKNGRVYRYPVKNLSDESRAKLPRQRDATS